MVSCNSEKKKKETKEDREHLRKMTEASLYFDQMVMRSHYFKIMCTLKLI